MKTILLDIDNTLIHSVTTNSSKHFFELNSTTYYIHIRENLKEFFDYLFVNFNVGIYTASTKVYTENILKILERENILKVDNLIYPLLTRENAKTIDYHTSPCSSIIIKSFDVASKLLNIPTNELILLDDVLHEEHPNYNQCIGGKNIYWDCEYRINNILNMIPMLETLK